MDQAAKYYIGAGVFILPALSDGFAIAQLEAQAHGLFVMASKFCGRAVENGLNGVIPEEPAARYIAAAVRDYIADAAGCKS
jgi:glycosyltransferase involved in cell wall biosynthesis